MVEGSDNKPGPRGQAPAENSASRTRQVPRMMVEQASREESVLDLPSVDTVGGEATQPTLARPRLVVLEERPVGLADAFASMGFLVRAAVTGVETVSMCAEHMPLAVIVGPGDAERRRVLTGALRFRFAGIAVIYVLPAPDASLRAAAMADGVHAVLSWPLPPSSVVLGAIPHRAEPQPLTGPLPSVTRVIPPSAALPALSSLASEPSATGGATGSAPLRRPAGFDHRSSMVATSMVATSSPPPEATMAGARPASIDDLVTVQVDRVAVTEHARAVPSVMALAEGLRASIPMLWALDDCARFLDGLVATDAAAHAQTVRQVARLLAQLQARIVDLEPGA